ncbi:hypothetical protein [Nocardioides antri]|uniref:Mce-associated membrane protein n=1 Tax=Nocardioides antri TaxID=2607659 RepID=A0A5B1M9L1_9ACTN|nr:hypothetical protein [Nocardioides antri]KAA1429126.1 hypothetical protein F0U47_02715 [Nocardioides antri]
MSKPAPRRPSRTTTPRPRKIAGRDVSPADAVEPAEAPPAEAPEATQTPRPAGTSERPRPRPQTKQARDEVDAPAGDGSDALASTRLFRALLVLVGVLVVVLVLQGLWFYLLGRTDDDRAPAADSSTSEDGEYVPISVTSGRPVVLTQLAVQEGVEAAAAAAQIMFSRDYQTYDEGVDNAVTLMTESFAEQYRGTAADVRRESIQAKTVVQIRVVAQGVVRTTDTELEALVFLNQYTTNGGEGPGATTTYTPYRALLKMVHTDKGWLVDGVDTK